MHYYTITTDGQRVKITLTRGNHILAAVSADPRTDPYVLIDTATHWQERYDAHPICGTPRALWKELPLDFQGAYHALDRRPIAVGSVAA